MKTKISSFSNQTIIGCDGNSNRFPTKEACEKMCKGK